MNLYKRSDRGDANWHVRFECKGKGYYWSTKTPDKALAAKRARHYRELVKAQAFHLVDSMKSKAGFPTYKEVFAEYLTLPSPGKATKKRNIGAMKAILKASGLSPNARLDTLRKALVLRWQGRGGVSPATSNSTLRKAKSLFSRRALWAYTIGVSAQVVEEFMQAPFLREVSRAPELPTPEAMDAAHRMLPGTRYWRAFLAGAYVGMRASEAAAFRKDWIEREACKVWIGGRPGFTTKSRDWRVVRVQPQILDEFLAAEGDYVVGKSPKFLMHREMSPVLRGMGFPSANPFHSLRRWFGSQIAERQGLWKAKDALGHANQSTTEASYARPMNAAEPVPMMGMPVPMMGMPVPTAG